MKILNAINKFNMKKYAMVLLIGCIFSRLSAQDKTGEEPYVTKSLMGEAINNIVCETSGGNISVSGGHTTDSRVEVFVTPNGNGKKGLSSEQLKSKVDDEYDLDLSVTGGKLTASAKPKHSHQDWKHSLSFSFKIYVPENVSTELVTSGGNILLENISGTEDFTTSGGNLDLSHLSGKAKGTISGGNIHLKDCKDEIDVA